MKPFNLEAALAGEPVVTRKGKKVENLTYFPSAEGFYSVASIVNGSLTTYTDKGRHLGDEYDSEADLFMAPKIKEYWVNLYPDGKALHHHSVEVANKYRMEGRLYDKPFLITVEE